MIASLSSFRPEYPISEPGPLALRTGRFSFVLLAMAAVYMDPTHYYSPWCFGQPTEEINESRFVSLVEVLELGHPWLRTHW